MTKKLFPKHEKDSKNEAHNFIEIERINGKEKHSKYFYFQAKKNRLLIELIF